MGTWRLRGVIFDMDGVLCDSEHLICEAARMMFRTVHGVDVGADEFTPFVGTGEDRYLGGVAERRGVRLDMPADKQRTYAIYLELIKGRLRPLPGVMDFTAACRARGLKLAVGSSADRIKVVGNLAEIGLPTERFDAIATGSDVARKKPFPDLFLRAAELIGVPAADCLVIEDAVSGVRAGKAAGAKVLGLTTSFPADALRAVGADWIAPDLSAVPGDIMASAAAQR
ncbi:MAG TPA: HAD-IA family hydrolase [Planctomycetota bacterium]|nr:HAD-IA family hydrolase [Planctomycetota bacterium]